MIVYRGPSMLDGNPIVAIVTLTSENRKTGNVASLWILADNGERPTEAIRSGGDSSVCGDCIHRSGSCYVNAGQGPNAVYANYLRGGYPQRDDTLLRGRVLRFGAYGDPAALPLGVLRELSSLASHTLGYTHQWRTCDAGYAEFLMASVETEGQISEAMMRGYRTFRAKLPEQRIADSEIVCPNVRGLTCDRCKACRGAGSGRNIVIDAHGFDWKVKRYRIALQAVT